MARRCLQDWANIAEIAAAIAVVISLAYVAYELKQNTLATETQTRQTLAAQDLVFLEAVLDRSVLASAQAKHEAGEELSPLETSQLIHWQHVNFRVFENAYYQFQKGSLEPRQWSRYAKIISKLMCLDPSPFPGARSMWNVFGEAFDADFQLVVDATIRSCGQ